MNRLHLTILFCFFNIISFSQIWEDELLKTNPNPTIQEKSIAFEEYRATHPYTKGNGFKPYAREMDFILERSSESGEFKADALFKEWEKIQESNAYSKTSTQSNWISKGPINTPIILSNGKKRGNGRVNCIAFDPVDPDIIWIGSPAGGLWKSVDGGSNWTTNTDGLPVIGVSHIAIDPDNNQIMYIVTGDAYATDTYSIGILKSTDGGITWNTTGLSYTVNQEKTVNKVIINPNHTDSLYAVTNSNILISGDAGANWLTVGAIGRWRDIEFKPNNSNVIYAAKQSSGGSNIYRTTDGGVNWVIIDNGISGSRYRPLIAVTPDNPEVVYALFSASDYSFHGLYKSSDSGDSWIPQSSTPNILGRETDGSDSGGQSWYDLSLGVATNNENLVYVGGINIWRSDNGGVNWDIDANSGNGSNYSYMHVDQHAFEFNPHTHVAYAGNDGGFYKYMENLNKWVDISDGLEISQFYNLGLSQSNPNRLVAGAQDNGTEMLTNSTWDAIMGGDGMECKIDHNDDDIIYAEYQYGGLRKSYNGGNSWDNIKPVSYEGGWNTPYEMHSSNSDILVIGYDEVYRSTSGGAIWDSISYNVSGGQAIRSIALAPSDENYIYVASYSKIKVTKDAGQSWTYIKPGLANYNMTDITVSNTNPDRAWVTFSEYNNVHKVYETNDAGNSWVNISGSNLPGLPVNCIVYQGGANDDLYIGTDIGVYYKNNTMSDWIPFNDGLPNVIVKELEIHYDGGSISAATFGRGVWESPLNTLSTNVYANEKINFKIYPNPAQDKITITTSQQNINITIFTVTGRKIIETTAKTINTSNFAKGCYIIEISNKNGFSRREKLIIK
ncbi:MAG: T9SS type A sorting domain-containing protein [Cryomorphaceae bacterium]|nr:T9SS type A sorting domain-containing protein [Cryomorphaceae bacterium]